MIALDVQTEYRDSATIPIDWQSGDKTGSGDYGTANDIAVLCPPKQEPIILTIYYTQKEPDAKWRDDVIVAAARIAMASFGY